VRVLKPSPRQVIFGSRFSFLVRLLLFSSLFDGHNYGISWCDFFDLFTPSILNLGSCLLSFPLLLKTTVYVVLKRYVKGTFARPNNFIIKDLIMEPIIPQKAC